MKVYVTTTGCYSDYGIDRVFTDKEKAEAYYAHLQKVDSDAGILEFEADEPQEEVARRYWKVKIDLLTGQIEPASAGECYCWAKQSDRSEWKEDSKPGKIRYKNNVDRFAYVSSYVSQEHANKVAAEVRQCVLAELGGVSNLETSEYYHVLRVRNMAGIAAPT